MRYRLPASEEENRRDSVRIVSSSF